MRRRSGRLGLAALRPGGGFARRTPALNPLLAGARIPTDDSVAQRPIIERDQALASGKRDRATRRTLAAADILAIAMALALAMLAAGEQPGFAALLAAPIIVLIVKVLGLYDRDELLLRKTTIDEAPQLFHVATALALTVSLIGSSLIRGATFPRASVFVFWAAAFILLLACRYAARARVRHRVSTERCLVLGTRLVAEELAEKLATTDSVKAEIVDRLDFGPGQLAGLLPQLRLAIAAHGIERVIIAPEEVGQNEIHEVVRAVKAAGVTVTFLPRIFEVLGASVVVDELSGLQLLAMRRLRISRSSLLLKRGLDLGVAGTGLLLASPLLVVIGLAIKLDSRGPVFFRQTRVGRNGERFEILKFRTMLDGSDADKNALRLADGAPGLFKLAADPRVTRVGRLLRKTSLDEIPQLLNVATGSMSLVGPRPLIVDEDSQVVGWHRRRLALTPGMTGPWQILSSAKVPMQEMVKIDYRYVTGWTFWTDIKILLRTIPYMLRGGGV